MKQEINSVVHLITLCLLCSCSYESSLSAQDYIRYIENESNGFKKIVVVKDLQYTVMYKPSQYVAYMEQGGTEDTTKYKKRLIDLSRTVWFNIYISSSDGSINPLKQRCDRDSRI